MNHKQHSINSSPRSAAYMRQGVGSALVQVMDCHLFRAKPLQKPMLTYCQLDSREQIPVKFELEIYHFHSRKCIWNYHLPKRQPFCPGKDELTHWGRDKMAAISQTILLNIFSLMKISDLRLKLSFLLLGGSINKYSNTGSDNGLAATRWKAIIWTNDG